MKGYRLNSSRFVFCFIIGIFILANITPSVAAEFCVGTVEELNDALINAASNGQEDIIKIRQGTYYGNFILDLPEFELFGVAIEGGYGDNCADKGGRPIKHSARRTK